MPAVVQDIGAMQKIASEQRALGKTIAVVPTMGALHEGHLTLIREAKRRADLVVATVFVNPTQFGAGEDFERYPRDLSRDVRLAGPAGADVVFAPAAAAMYPAGLRTSVQVTVLEDLLEGRVRPGHFRGVATVVLMLFEITRPHYAVFGQKDAQQVVIIRKMIDDLHLGIALIVVPTVREADGLAMSSRNAYLSPQQRSEAAVLYRSLRLAESRIREGLTDAGAVIAEMTALITGGSSGVPDYVSIAAHETLKEVQRITKGQQLLVSLAVRFGSTRLIDNLIISP